ESLPPRAEDFQKLAVQAQQFSLRAMVIALEVVSSLLSLAGQRQEPALIVAIEQGLQRLGRIVAFAMEHIERLEYSSTPLRSSETYFLIDAEHAHSARHVFLFRLHREVGGAFAALHSTSHALAQADQTRPTFVQR